jgi:hypothetical protein
MLLSFVQALGETASWFKRALVVEPVKGHLRLSGYSACGQDGGVQLPRQYVDGKKMGFLCCFFFIPCMIYITCNFVR